MLLIILQLVGVCSQLLDDRIQNVENSVFSVIMQVDRKCRCGEIWFQLNIIMLRKLVFRKNVVSILQVSSGLMIVLVILFSRGQLVLNWKVMMMLLIMFMLNDIVKIFCQKKYSLCYMGNLVCSQCYLMKVSQLVVLMVKVGNSMWKLMMNLNWIWDNNNVFKGCFLFVIGGILDYFRRILLRWDVIG